MPYLLFLKKQQNLKLSSAANYTWRFMSLRYFYTLFFLPNFHPADMQWSSYKPVVTSTVENCVDPDQMASSEAS